MRSAIRPLKRPFREKLLKMAHHLGDITQQESDQKGEKRQGKDKGPMDQVSFLLEPHILARDHAGHRDSDPEDQEVVQKPSQSKKADTRRNEGQ